MAKARAPEPKAANLSPDQLKAAIPKLDRRIADLKEFDPQKTKSRSDPEVRALETSIDETLSLIFGHGTVEYNRYRVAAHLDTAGMNMMRATPHHEVIAGYEKGKDRAIALLGAAKKSMLEQIEDAASTDNAAATSAETDLKRFDPENRRVFIVHGHDEGAKQSIARTLAQLDFSPIILHEMANQGRTVIEKFEYNAEVGFAIILMTPDDVGYPQGAPDKAKPRARQNVILELGYFVGALGRNRVMVLYKGDVEMPSDYVGVVYEPLDEKGAWSYRLAKELRAAGYEVDMNKL